VGWWVAGGGGGGGGWGVKHVHCTRPAAHPPLHTARWLAPALLHPADRMFQASGTRYGMTDYGTCVESMGWWLTPNGVR